MLNEMKIAKKKMFGRKIINLLLAFFLIAQISTSAFVLCYGENGHIAVEIAHHGSCDQTESNFSVSLNEINNNSTSSNPVFFIDTHGSCKDIPFRNDAVIHHSFSFQKIFSKFFSLIFSTPISSLSSSPERASVDLLGFLSPIIDHALFALSTVILLS